LIYPNGLFFVNRKRAILPLQWGRAGQFSQIGASIGQGLLILTVKMRQFAPLKITLPLCWLWITDTLTEKNIFAKLRHLPNRSGGIGASFPKKIKGAKWSEKSPEKIQSTRLCRRCFFSPGISR